MKEALVSFWQPWGAKFDLSSYIYEKEAQRETFLLATRLQIQSNDFSEPLNTSLAVHSW